MEALSKLGSDARRGGIGMTLGIELPLDNDFSTDREERRRSGLAPRETFGIPDLSQHLERAQLVDQLGFRALWMRDVPLWLPQTFGDAGQVFEPVAYLGYLAAATKNILLGTGAIVLPLRNPLMLAKQAATIDVLSGGRLLMGVASGDRPQEYPAFGIDFDSRGERYRDGVKHMRREWQRSATSSDTEPKLLPAPKQQQVPLIAVGRSQQSIEWTAQNMDGFMTYHRHGPAMNAVVEEFNSLVPQGEYKPVIVPMHIDLSEDPNAPFEPIRFGARGGSQVIGQYLELLQDAGVAHVALNLRPSRRPVEDALAEIAESILPAYAPKTTASIS